MFHLKFGLLIRRVTQWTHTWLRSHVLNTAHEVERVWKRYKPQRWVAQILFVPIVYSLAIYHSCTVFVCHSNGEICEKVRNRCTNERWAKNTHRRCEVNEKNALASGARVISLTAHSLCKFELVFAFQITLELHTNTRCLFVLMWAIFLSQMVAQMRISFSHHTYFDTCQKNVCESYVGECIGRTHKKANWCCVGGKNGNGRKGGRISAVINKCVFIDLAWNFDVTVTMPFEARNHFAHQSRNGEGAIPKSSKANALWVNSA